MLKGFKEFIMRGNVIDLAVAVVIGAAFAALVSSFTQNLVQPLVGLVLGGGIEAGTLTISDQVFDFSAIINAVITFVLTAAVVYFVFVAPMNKVIELSKRRTAQEEVQEVAGVVDEQLELLKEIRDQLATLNQVSAAGLAHQRPAPEDPKPTAG